LTTALRLSAESPLTYSVSFACMTSFEHSLPRRQIDNGRERQDGRARYAGVYAEGSQRRLALRTWAAAIWRRRSARSPNSRDRLMSRLIRSMSSAERPTSGAPASSAASAGPRCAWLRFASCRTLLNSLW